MQKFLAIILWSLFGVFFVYSLAVLGFPQNTLGFASPTRALAAGSQESAEIGGVVIDLPTDAPGRFYLTDRATTVAVQAAGSLPEFIQKQSVVVISGTFVQDNGKPLLQADNIRPMNAFQQFAYMSGYGFFVWVSYTLSFLLLALNFFLPLSREQDLRRSLARRAGRGDAA